MDHLDKAREEVVEALLKLDEAVEGAMRAQAPQSDIEQAEKGIFDFKQGLSDTLKIVARAEVSLQRAKDKYS